jgi:glycosyltransferase involved in cell wall biosynthesis
MSILEQETTAKFKVTIVDDYGTDNYDEIIKRFKEYYPINYIRLDKNVGPGKARQEAIDKTDGEYITFIDSDDLFYNTDSLGILYKEISKGFDQIFTEEYDERKKIVLQNDGDLHGKIFKRSYIESKNIRFNDSRYHEDNYFNNLVYLSGATYRRVNEVTYVYCYNKESLTQKDSEKEFERLELLFKNMNEMYSHIEFNRELFLRYVEFISNKYRYFNRLYKNANDKNKKYLYDLIYKYDNKNIELLGITRKKDFINKMLEINLDEYKNLKA